MRERDYYSPCLADFNPLDPFKYADRTKNLDDEVSSDVRYRVQGNKLLIGFYMFTTEVILISSSLIGLAWILHEFKDLVGG